MVLAVTSRRRCSTITFIRRALPISAVTVNVTTDLYACTLSGFRPRIGRRS